MTTSTATDRERELARAFRDEVQRRGADRCKPGTLGYWWAYDAAQRRVGDRRPGAPVQGTP